MSGERTPGRGGGGEYLGHHASPGDNMSVDGLSSLLLMVRNGFEEAVKVLVDAVIVALEVLEAAGQIHA